MLEPGYNLQAEKLLGKIKILDDALKDLDIKIDPLLPCNVEFGDPTTSKKKINQMSALWTGKRLISFIFQSILNITLKMKSEHFIKHSQLRWHYHLLPLFYSRK